MTSSKEPKVSVTFSSGFVSVEPSSLCLTEVTKTSFSLYVFVVPFAVTTSVASAKCFPLAQAEISSVSAAHGGAHPIGF